MNLQFNAEYTMRAQEDPGMPNIDVVYSDDEFIVERHHVREHSVVEFRLVVKRRDKQTIGDWRTLQDAKNQAAGADREAMQIFPPESEVTDTANHYHLWVLYAERTAGLNITPHVAGP